MILKYRMTVMLFCIAVIVSVQKTWATVLSVRLIKVSASFCSEKPELHFLSNPTSYSINSKDWFSGENVWEIFFEIETNDANIPLESIVFLAKGVEIARAIVGRTDVPFTKNGDSYQFTLVKDTTDGRHVQTAYQNPQGGPFMWIYHNWKDRVNGNYLNIPYPEKLLASSQNYELACQEMLRLMGDMSGLHQTFYGEMILLNCESSAPRAHLDFPPHWHLQHWEHGHNEEYGIDWRKKQYIISHYYLDSIGNIICDKQSIHQSGQLVKRIQNEFMEGDTCIWNDKEGNLIFRQVIKDGCLHYLKSNGDVWTMRPDKIGGEKGIWISKNGSAVAMAIARDDGENGITILAIDYYDGDKKTGTWSDTIKYDPITGNLR